MSNYIKNPYIQTPSTKARIINSNARVEELVKSWNASPLPTQGIREAEYESDEYTEDGVPFEAGLMAEEIELEAQITPEQLIAAAEDQAVEVIEAANARAEQIEMAAQEKADIIYEESRENGYSEGMAQAKAELEAKEQALQNQLNELQESLEAEYQQKHQQMESELVDVIAEVLKKNFHIFAQDEDKMLLYLIRKTIYGIESAKNFKIRVSPEFVGTLIGNIEEIKLELGNDIAIDVAHDDSLGEGDCVIETEYGVYHCGIDLQLDNLISQMKALSQ